ncbi:Amino acid--[acyl-carrier-protein] ligase 2 [compost metagenome]
MCSDNFSFHMKGYTALGAEGYEWMTQLDQLFKRFLQDKEYEEYHIPALIDEDVLQKCGYFSSFPHQLTVAAIADQSHYEAIAAEKTIRAEYLATDHQYLTPAACLHIYPMLKACSYPKIVTTKARVYRYEGDRLKPFTRLWDFTVRELVFVGGAEFVERQLNEVKAFALDLAQQICPEAYITNANDPFYNSQQNKIKSKLQRANALKAELVIPIKGEEVAVASFNSHGTHFSGPFEFDRSGEVVTACTGFGIERWIAACLEYNYNPVRQAAQFHTV